MYELLYGVGDIADDGAGEGEGEGEYEVRDKGRSGELGAVSVRSGVEQGR